MGNRVERLKDVDSNVEQYLSIRDSYYGVPFNVPDILTSASFNGYNDRLCWMDTYLKGEYYIPCSMILNGIVDNNAYFQLEDDAKSYDQVFNDVDDTWDVGDYSDYLDYINSDTYRKALRDNEPMIDTVMPDGCEVLLPAVMSIRVLKGNNTSMSED